MSTPQVISHTVTVTPSLPRLWDRHGSRHHHLAATRPIILWVNPPRKSLLQISSYWSTFFFKGLDSTIFLTAVFTYRSQSLLILTFHDNSAGKLFFSCSFSSSCVLIIAVLDVRIAAVSCDEEVSTRLFVFSLLCWFTKLENPCSLSICHQDKLGNG